MKVSESHIYIEFLRYCLDTSREIPRSVAEINWHALLLFAREQAIVGIYWQGIVASPNQPEGTLPFYGNKPIDDDIMEWMADINDIVSLNHQVDKAATIASEKFLRKGFDNCILKGQGNALLYPHPELRISGDVDIWLRPNNSQQLDLDSSNFKYHTLDSAIDYDTRQIISYVRQFTPNAKTMYHHIHFVEINGAPIEVHYRPSWMSFPKYNRRQQIYFYNKFQDRIKTDLNFYIPDFEFNLIFQLGHIYRHVLYEGIGLRQLIDYYYLLKKGHKKYDANNLTKIIKHLGLIKITGGVMWIMNQVLGLDEKYLAYPMNEKIGNLILSEIIEGGNFGQYSDDKPSATGTLKHNYQRIKRDIRMASYFPSECLSEPFFRIWHYFWRLNHK